MGIVNESVPKAKLRERTTAAGQYAAKARTRMRCAPAKRRSAPASDMPFEISGDYLAAKSTQLRFVDDENGRNSGPDAIPRREILSPRPRRRCAERRSRRVPRFLLIVIPAKAGEPGDAARCCPWTPASRGGDDGEMFAVRGSVPMSQLDISRLMRPRSIAIVGISPEPSSAGFLMLKTLEDYAYPGAIHLVSRNRSEIDGRPCVKTIEDLPDGVDAAMLLIPRVAIEDAVKSCARRRRSAASSFSPPVSARPAANGKRRRTASRRSPRKRASRCAAPTASASSISSTASR